MSVESSNQRTRSLIVAPLDTLRGAARTVVDLVFFIDEHSDQINNVEETFVRTARASHSEHLENQHREAARLYHDHVHTVIKLRREQGEEASKERAPELREDLRKRVTELTGHENDYWRYWQIWQEVQDRPNELFLLTKALFISLVSDFEMLVSRTVSAQLQLRPEILNISEQKYSLADVSAFESIDEFKDYCAESFADGVMRGGFDEWMKWFTTRHKLSIPQVTHDNDDLVEIFQRRHLLVHAGGVVNDQYLKRCVTKATKGDTLRVGRDYLLHSADLLLSAGIKLMGGATQAVGSPDVAEFVGHSISRHLSYELLKSGHFRVVRDILEWHLPTVSDESDRLVCQVNLWIARKALGGIDAIRSEVEAWRADVLADRYKLAKAALLDDLETAYDLVLRLVASEELTVQDWNEWPLLRDVRRFESEAGREPISQSLSTVSKEQEGAHEHEHA